jgi:hypothetical protein
MHVPSGAAHTVIRVINVIFDMCTSFFARCDRDIVTNPAVNFQVYCGEKFSQRPTGRLPGAVVTARTTGAQQRLNILFSGWISPFERVAARKIDPGSRLLAQSVVRLHPLSGAWDCEVVGLEQGSDGDECLLTLVTGRLCRVVGRRRYHG